MENLDDGASENIRDNIKFSAKRVMVSMYRSSINHGLMNNVQHLQNKGSSIN
jgi:hypothetical protein